MFSNRIDAGERLAQTLADIHIDATGASILTLAIPRGGVIVARPVAERLHTAFDVVIPRKIGAPSNSELAIGATTLDGTTVIDSMLVRRLGVTDDYLATEIERQREEIRRRLIVYRGSPAEADPAGSVCIVVDDGLATGATAEAAVRSLSRRGAARVILALPVASAQGLDRLRRVADEVACLVVPQEFYAVGQWYDEFDQVSDDEVVAALKSAPSRR